MSDKHEVLLRMKSVELLAYWEGRVVTNRLMSWFGISRQQAGHDIKRYISERNPKSLVYSPASKGYIPANNFKPVLTQGHINEYLDMISGIESGTFSVTVESCEHLTAIQKLDRSVKPDVLREVLKACRAFNCIEITYASMNSPIPHKRVISPHTLIYTGFRWHVRAYCHKRGDYRDFLLSRIQSPVFVTSEFVTNDADDLWQESATLSLVPNPNLSEDQKRLVEQDFCMLDGQLNIDVRKALAHYALQRYQAGITEDDIKEPFKFPVVLASQSSHDIKPFLFNGDTSE